ncbi:MAG: hypothetical protein R3A79_05060 [Nannocystaceae bacterium]
MDAFDDLETLVPLALRLHVRSSHRAWAYREGAAVFRGYQLGDNRIAVAAQLRGFPSEPRDAVHTLFKDVTLETASEGILHWLDNVAAPPPKPWFDGGESLGLQLYHVAYGQQCGPYGYMVAESKWFEVHK